MISMALSKSVRVILFNGFFLKRSKFFKNFISRIIAQSSSNFLLDYRILHSQVNSQKNLGQNPFRKSKTRKFTNFQNNIQSNLSDYLLLFIEKLIEYSFKQVISVEFIKD